MGTEAEVRALWSARQALDCGCAAERAAGMEALILLGLSAENAGVRSRARQHLALHYDVDIGDGSLAPAGVEAAL